MTTRKRITVCVACLVAVSVVSVAGAATAVSQPANVDSSGETTFTEGVSPPEGSISAPHNDSCTEYQGDGSSAGSGYGDGRTRVSDKKTYQGDGSSAGTGYGNGQTGVNTSAYVGTGTGTNKSAYADGGTTGTNKSAYFDASLPVSGVGPASSQTIRTDGLPLSGVGPADSQTTRTDAAGQKSTNCAVEG